VAADYDVAIARVPRWIVVLGLAGTGVAGRMGGTLWAVSFILGSIAAWINYKLLVRAVDKMGPRLGEPAETGRPKRTARTGVGVFIQFAFLVLGAFVILRVSGLNIVVALCGLLVCPAAVMVEIFYELLTYGHS
jgi:hypothetical protein